MDTLTSKRAYHKRRAGDVVNGAILFSRPELMDIPERAVKQSV